MCALNHPEWRLAPGLVPYPKALEEMENRVRAIQAGEQPELIWLLEHPPLYTAGTSAKAADLLSAGGLPVYETGRGGEYTWHGPGQRVAYVMLDLNKRERDLRRYVWRLEEWIIQALAALGVTGQRRCGRIGIWVARTDGGGLDDKIAAIGVRVKRWVTMHGVAINVAPDLAGYRGIVPCGIREHGVTSLAALGVKATMADLDAALKTAWGKAFNETPDTVPNACENGR